jgi:hypothetical protein
MKYFSETTGREYEAESSAFYRNLVQAAWLLSKPDAVLLDIFCDSGGKMVLVFPKELHKKYIQEWSERNRLNQGDKNG